MYVYICECICVKTSSWVAAAPYHLSKLPPLNVQLASSDGTGDGAFIRRKIHLHNGPRASGLPTRSICILYNATIETHIFLSFVPTYIDTTRRTLIHNGFLSVHVFVHVCGEVPFTHTEEAQSSSGICRLPKIWQPAKLPRGGMRGPV